MYNSNFYPVTLRVTAVLCDVHFLTSVFYWNGNFSSHRTVYIALSDKGIVNDIFASWEYIIGSYTLHESSRLK